MNRQAALKEATYLMQSQGGEVEDYLPDWYKRYGDGRSSDGRYPHGESTDGDVVSEYIYRDERGEPYLMVQRRETISDDGTKKKQFPQKHWDGQRWQWRKPPGPKIPYRLPELIKAAPSEPVFICEGEKDADNVAALGLIATCASEGAGKWTPDLNKWFSERKTVYVLQDNDEPGRMHARKVAQNLRAVGGCVRIVALPGLAEQGDVSDWIEAGGTKEQLLMLCASARAKPVIAVKNGELSTLASEGEEALLQSSEPIFQRGGDLVRPIVERVEATRGRETFVAHLRRIDAVYLRDLLCRSAEWTKFTARGNRWVPTDPPLEIASTIIARVGEWKFPSIAGVITTPTMRPDGSLLLEPGYDPQTKLILIKPPTMQPIADAPTEKDAREALTLLESLLKEFPFADQVALSVALSALMTPVVRGAFPVAPMHTARAPVASSGKSYLFDLVAAIAIGHPMPVMAAGSSEDETEKRLGAALMIGQPLISIDNVNGELKGDALCQVIERPIVEMRILGKSERVRIEARGTSLFCTGNNIILVGDLCRRVLIATLDPQIERPELREFHNDPMAAVMADRGSYIRAALTICRAYIVAERPGVARPLASFGGWSDTVRSALIWLGKADPVDSMAVARAEDPERAALREMLSVWADVIGIGWEERITLRDVIALASETTSAGMGPPGYRWPALRAAVYAILGARKDDEARSLGNWVRRFKGRFEDNLRLASKADEKGKAEWWVEHQAETTKRGKRHAEAEM
jgi:putative DNA primase/helicase